MPLQSRACRFSNVLVRVCARQAHLDFLDHTAHTRDAFGGVFGGHFLHVAAHVPGERHHAVVDFHTNPCGIHRGLPEQFIIDVLLDTQVAFHTSLLLCSHSPD